VQGQSAQRFSSCHDDAIPLKIFDEKADVWRSAKPTNL